MGRRWCGGGVYFCEGGGWDVGGCGGYGDVCGECVEEGGGVVCEVDGVGVI